MINLLICDDQDVVCQGLAAIFSTSRDIHVAGETNNGLEALEFIKKNKVDVVLMDLKMPVLNGIQATKQIKEYDKNIKILVLTTYDADDWVFDAIRNGADGYLLKDSSREHLIQAVLELMQGKTPVDYQIAGKLFSQIARSPIQGKTTLGRNLTEREIDVLRLIARGMNNEEIAKELFLSEGTIRNYVSSILEKLDVADRTQAAVIALRHGIVD